MLWSSEIASLPSGFDYLLSESSSREESQETNTVRPYRSMRHRRTQHREEQRPSPTVRQGGGCVGSTRNCSLVAFVHIDAYTSKYGDDAREGELCRLSHSSRAYCIYHPGEGHCFRNMERAFPVLENLPCFHLPTNGPDYLDDDEEAYARDVVGYTSFLDPVVFYNRGDYSSTTGAPAYEDYAARKPGYNND